MSHSSQTRPSLGHTAWKTEEYFCFRLPILDQALFLTQHCAQGYPVKISTKTFALAMPAMLLVAFLCTTARADDRVIFLGGSEFRANTSPQQSTYTYQSEFEHTLSEHFSVSLDYTNQGHFDRGVSHHRDLDGVNLWAHTDVLSKLELAAGLGPVYYYDTVGNYNGRPADLHGLGVNFSLAATWKSTTPLVYQARLSYVAAGSFKTTALLLGVGYRFGERDSYASSASAAADDDNSDSSGPAAADHSRSNEVTIYSGLTVVNQPGNSNSRAYALELRRNVGDYLQYTVTAQSEGHNALIDRKGIAAQLWLAKSFLDNRLSLGVGIGPYLAEDSIKAGSTHFVTAMRSVSAAYQLTPQWSARIKFDRVITGYNRDTDIFMVGIGRRF